MILLALVLILEPGTLFYFPRTHPVIWVLVMILYPGLSAYPQELIYRSFFFHRYSKIFKNNNQVICASSISFAALHNYFS